MFNTRYIEETEKELILKDFHLGMNTVQLGKKYNRNNTTIGKFLKKNGLSARNIKSKLTKEEIDEAYSLYLTEEYNTITLGEKYNVSERTIANSFEKYGYKLRPSGHIPELKNENYFKIIDTEAKAYYLGFLMCDGSIINDKNNLALHIELKEEDSLFLMDLCKELGLSKDRVSIYSRKDRPNKTCKININSNVFCNNLVSKGVTRNKVGKKHIPYNIPKNLMHHCIRGMVDADGSISKEKHYFGLYGNGTMVNEVVNLLNEILDIDLKIYDYEVKRTTTTNQNYFKLICNYLYKDATVFLQRKYPY